MEGNVWKLSRWSVLAAILGLNLSTYTTAAQKQVNPTSSYDVLASDAASTSTLKNTSVKDQNVLRISRKEVKRLEGTAVVVGVLAYEGKFLAYTLEPDNLKIPTGRYEAGLKWSKRFGEQVVYIQVPKRSGIEIHRGNCQADSGGCVLVGTAVNGACLDNSRQAMKHIVSKLPSTFTVVVE